MTTTPTLSPTDTHPKPEIIFPQGEFWSYERQQKELALAKIEELRTRLRELGINPDEKL